jgi:hypothetical protein
MELSPADVATIRHALTIAKELACEEAENRAAAGSDMSDYVNEAAEVDARCFDALAILED